MSLLYLSALIVSLLGLGALDARHRLALFGGAPVRTLVTVAVGVLFFLGWDVAGISAGVFFRGSGPFQSGVLLGPELPLEELFFLMVLCYVTLLSYLAVARVRQRRGR